MSNLLIKARLLLTAAATLMLAGCIASEAPLLTDARPLLGEQFEGHLYASFVDGKAGDFHTSFYRWKNGRYTRSSGLAHDVKSFVAQSFTGNDYLIEGTDDNEKLFNYWIARKIAVGVYIIFPLNETDTDDTTRNTACDKNRPGACWVRTYDQLAVFARATAAKPVRDPALAVIVAR